MKSGEKSFKRLALEESHQYYQEAFALMSRNPTNQRKMKPCLWIFFFSGLIVYQRRASLVEFSDLFEKHENIVISLGDKEKNGYVLCQTWRSNAL